MGIDFYKENIPSHSWLEDCRISIMKLFSEKDWVKFFQNAPHEVLEFLGGSCRFLGGSWSSLDLDI